MRVGALYVAWVSLNSSRQGLRALPATLASDLRQLYIPCARVGSAFGAYMSRFDDKLATMPVCGLVQSGLLEQLTKMRVRVSSSKPQ